MKGSRPTQAYLSAETDMTKTSETQKVIEEMVDGLNDHRIDDIGEFFSRIFDGWAIKVAAQKKVFVNFKKIGSVLFSKHFLIRCV